MPVYASTSTIPELHRASRQASGFAARPAARVPGTCERFVNRGGPVNRAGRRVGDDQASRASRTITWVSPTILFISDGHADGRAEKGGVDTVSGRWTAPMPAMVTKKSLRTNPVECKKQQSNPVTGFEQRCALCLILNHHLRASMVVKSFFDSRHSWPLSVSVRLASHVRRADGATPPQRSARSSA